MAGAPQEVNGMASPLGTRMAGCAWVALAMLAGMSGANAETGRIVFSGAVVEPTCSTADVQPDPVAPSGSVDELVPRHLTCGQTAANPGRSYSRTVISLDAAAIASDRLLGYFASYANTANVGGTQARLVVRTYE